MAPCASVPASVYIVSYDCSSTEPICSSAACIASTESRFCCSTAVPTATDMDAVAATIATMTEAISASSSVKPPRWSEGRRIETCHVPPSFGLAVVGVSFGSMAANPFLNALTLRYGIGPAKPFRRFPEPV